jgi:outer membrane protein TolC
MASPYLIEPSQTYRAGNGKQHRGLRHLGFPIRCRLVASAILTALPALSFAQTTTTTTPAGVPGQAIPGTQGNSSFASSVPAKPIPGVIPISLQDAIDRGLRQNLGLLLSSTDVGAARGQRWQQLSTLLPHASFSSYVDASKINFGEIGLNFTIPGVNLPSAATFSYFDARAGVTQTLFDWKAINAARAASQSLKSAEYTYKDARDLVVLAVGYTYLQAIADEARIATAQAQVRTAQALYDQASDQVKAGTSPEIDALRAKVELQTRQQQLIQARNNLSIQKLTVARVIGFAPGQEFDLTDKSPYQRFEDVGVEEALKRAYASRSDYQSAMKDVRAAELSREAARAGYLPSLSFSADYGTGGAHPSNATSVYDVRGTLSIPIFTGGSVHGDVLQADARLQQSRERLDSLHAQIDADVRTALFNLQSSAEQVRVALSNIDLAEQTLTQSRDRFTAGVTDTVEVVQSQELVASAHEQYISSLYDYNFAEIALIRAMGAAESGFREYFKVQ